VAERFADGQTDAVDLRWAEVKVRTALEELEPAWRAAHGADRRAMELRHTALSLAMQVCLPLAPKGAYYASSNAYIAAGSLASHSDSPNAPRSDRRAAAPRADLLRCLFGELPSDPPEVSAAVLAWNDRCIPDLAAALYDERDFSPQRTGILADALEEAGRRRGIHRASARTGASRSRLLGWSIGCWASTESLSGRACGS